MKRLIAGLGILIALVAGAPNSSAAGGWVVVSLDTVPEWRAGDTIEVGFTVLRHGVTPETSDDLSVVLTDSRGAAYRFDAVPQGAVGHHVAAVAVPAAGSYTWEVTGEVVAAELGSIDVTEPADSAGGGGVAWPWDALQWGSLALAVGLGGLAGHDVVRNRRRHSAGVSAA